MRELDDRNCEDRAVKAKICGFCQCPALVHMTRTADTDLGIIPITKDALLEAVEQHIASKRRVFMDWMDNGDIAYIATDCNVEDAVLYVKVRFFCHGKQERMLVISAHPPRRWC